MRSCLRFSILISFAEFSFRIDPFSKNLGFYSRNITIMPIAQLLQQSDACCVLRMGEADEFPAGSHGMQSMDTGRK